MLCVYEFLFCLFHLNVSAVRLGTWLSSLPHPWWLVPSEGLKLFVYEWKNWSIWVPPWPPLFLPPNALPGAVIPVPLALWASYLRPSQDPFLAGSNPLPYPPSLAQLSHMAPPQQAPPPLPTYLLPSRNTALMFRERKRRDSCSEPACSNGTQSSSSLSPLPAYRKATPTIPKAVITFKQPCLPGSCCPQFTDQEHSPPSC